MCFILFQSACIPLYHQLQNSLLLMFKTILFCQFVIDHLRFAVMKDAFCIHHIGRLCCRMHVRCCMFVAIINFIGSNSSRFPFHQSPVGKPKQAGGGGFLGKKWLRRTANGQPGTDAAVPMHLKTEKDVFVRDTHRLSGQKQFHQGGRLRRLTSH